MEDIPQVMQDSSASLLFRAVAEQSHELYALLDEHGNVIYLNPAGQEMLGWGTEPSPFNILLVEADAMQFSLDILPALRNQRRWEGALHFSHRHTALPVAAQASLFAVPNKSPDESLIFVCVARERGRDLIRLERQERMLEAATQVASDILASQSGIEALEHFAEVARRLTGARYAAIGVATLEGDQLEAFVTAGLTQEQEKAIGKRPRGEGVLGLLLARTTPLRLSDLTGHMASAGFPANHPPMSAFLGVPIRHGNAVLGSLYLTEKEGGFDEVDEVTVNALGAHLAVAIRNLQMLKRQRALVSGLIAAQEEERRAVAYDLHDGLTQYVMAAQMHLSVFRGALERGDITLEKTSQRTAFDTAYKYLTDSVIESRRLVNGLRSLALDDMGLAGALEQLIVEEKAHAGWKETDFTHNLGTGRFSQTMETSLYRIAQEALTNARKHAQTERVDVILLLQPGPGTSEQIYLEVRDYGKGFAPGESNTDYTHIGLHGITERVRLLQGRLSLESEPGKGTRLSVRLPVFPQSEEEIQEVL